MRWGLSWAQPLLLTCFRAFLSRRPACFCVLRCGPRSGRPRRGASPDRRSVARRRSYPRSRPVGGRQTDAAARSYCVGCWCPSGSQTGRSRPFPSVAPLDRCHGREIGRRPSWEFKLDRALETYSQRVPACFTHEMLPPFARRATESAIYYRLKAASNAWKRLGHLGSYSRAADWRLPSPGGTRQHWPARWPAECPT